MFYAFSILLVFFPLVIFFAYYHHPTLWIRERELSPRRPLTQTPICQSSTREKQFDASRQLSIFCHQTFDFFTYFFPATEVIRRVYFNVLQRRFLFVRVKSKAWTSQRFCFICLTIVCRVPLFCLVQLFFLYGYKYNAMLETHVKELFFPY